VQASAMQCTTRSATVTSTDAWLSLDSTMHEVSKHVWHGIRIVCCSCTGADVSSGLGHVLLSVSQACVHSFRLCSLLTIALRA
jgi:hypothetical protein